MSLGLVGLGRMGRFHAENLAGRIPRAELAKVVDADEGVAHSVAEQLGGIDWSTNYDDLLNAPDIEAVVIATPTPLHVGMIEAAAAAGKQVFSEKPISLDPKLTRSAIETARAAGVKLQVGFHRRFDPDYRMVKQRINAGDVGDVYLFRTSSRDPALPRFAFLRNSGGLFADFSLHDFDLARWLVGEVEEVSVMGATLSDPTLEQLGDLDNAVIALRFVGGALGVLDSSRVSGYGYECSSEIMGSHATLRVGGQKQVGPEMLTATTSRHNFLSKDVERWAAAYKGEMEAFVESVSTGQEPEVDGSDDLAALAIAQAAALSHRERRTVRLVTGETATGVAHHDVS